MTLFNKASHDVCLGKVVKIDCSVELQLYEISICIIVLWSSEELSSEGQERLLILSIKYFYHLLG